MMAARRDPTTLLTPEHLHLFNEGSDQRIFECLGSHPRVVDGAAGTFFAVWAPNAENVHVMGDWNGWSAAQDPLRVRGDSGIWEGFVRGVTEGAHYKYHVASRLDGYRADKADPVAFFAEVPPQQASIVCNLDYRWGDGDWMAQRGAKNRLDAPMSIYELHVGSWRRVPEEGNRSLGYRELAEQLPDYVHDLGFTHVELLPITEHPFYGSWGYQTTGYFAPTSRYGSPQDLMFLIDRLHQRGIGVILDWVPSHFPTDEHGIGYFDGTHLYEHGDPRQGFHPDWNSFIFNYGRAEVRSFLQSSALFWLERYHIDGLRVDAVASMLYLDYSRKPGEWIPNEHGGIENLAAIRLLRELNERVYAAFPDVQTIAEESTAWPKVSRPTDTGGLGFGLKWDMGWMHDTLAYMARDPIHRKFNHAELTFRGVYAFSENFVLPLSHDEVVHGKGSLLSRMPGDVWQKHANLRLLLGYMYTQPGKKLIFMGGEFGQHKEWNHEASLDWHLLEDPAHAGLQRWLRDLNTCYRGEPALHELDCDPAGFSWLDCDDSEQSTLSYLRRGRSSAQEIAVVCNFTPIARTGFRVGVPQAGHWRELLNSDAPLYGGSGQGNLGGVRSQPVSAHGQPHSLALTLPPLATVVFKRETNPAASAS